MDEIGERIRKRRQALNMTQEELAEKCNMSRQQICRYENGKAGLSMDFLEIIAASLQMKTRELIPDRGRPSGPPEKELQECFERLKGCAPAELRLILSLAGYIQQSAVDFIQEESAMRLSPASQECVSFEDVQMDSHALVISVPRSGFSEVSLQILWDLIQSRNHLIRKAIGADTLDFVLSDDRIIFPWFLHLPGKEEIAAVLRLIFALCTRAKTEKPAPRQKDYESERYTFSRFLYAIGLGDPEYKSTRKQLLLNLSGTVPYPDLKTRNAQRQKQRRLNNASSGSVLYGDTEWIPENKLRITGDECNEI